MPPRVEDPIVLRGGGSAGYDIRMLNPQVCDFRKFRHYRCRFLAKFRQFRSKWGVLFTDFVVFFVGQKTEIVLFFRK